MEYIDEDKFKMLFNAGAISSFDIVFRSNGHVYIYFTVGLENSMIHTKRGEVKSYRVETALALLKSLGIAVVKINMSLWTNQKEIA
jgi:hypothetical protein